MDTVRERVGATDESAWGVAWRTWAPAAVVALITLLGLLRRLAYLEDPNLWADELRRADWYLAPDLVTAATSSVCNCFWTTSVVLWTINLALPDTVLGLRLPLVLASTMTIPALYLLGRELGTTVGGLVAAAFHAVSPLSLRFSTEVGPYPVMELVAVLIVIAAVRALRSGLQRRWVLTWAITASLFAQHVLMLPLLGTTAAFLLVRAWSGTRGAPGRVMAMAGSVVVRSALFPLALAAHGLYTSLSGDYLGAGVVLESLDQFAGHVLWWNEPLVPWLWRTVVVGVVSLLPALWLRRRQPEGVALLLTAICAAGSLSMVVLSSLIGGQFSSRYIVHVVPLVLVSLTSAAGLLVSTLWAATWPIGRNDLGHAMWHLRALVHVGVASGLVLLVLVAALTPVNIGSDGRTRTDYHSVLEDVGELDEAPELVASIPDEGYWLRAADLHDLNVPTIDAGRWDLDGHPMFDCQVVANASSALLLSAEYATHQVEADITDDGTWHVIEAHDHYQSGWLLLERSSTWEVTCHAA